MRISSNSNYLSFSMISFSFSFSLFLFLSSFVSASTFTAAEIKLFESSYNAFFRFSSIINRMNSLNSENRAKFLNYGLEKTVEFKNNPTALANVYWSDLTLLYFVIYYNFTECMDIFIKYAKTGQFNFNRNFNQNGNQAYFSITKGLSMNLRGNFFNFNPVLCAIVENKKDLVESILKDKHHIPLKLDSMALKLEGSFYLGARSLARLIVQKNSRESMLNVLRINPINHDMTTITEKLKGDLKITVREAVLNNNIQKLEAALWLGNFGTTKTDTNVIKYAFNHKNCEMVEILAMEGFAKPNFSDLNFKAKFKDNELSRVRFILNPYKSDPPKKII